MYSSGGNGEISINNKGTSIENDTTEKDTITAGVDLLKEADDSQECKAGPACTWATSNDLADLVVVTCALCEARVLMSCLRAHTKSAHAMTITEYKDQFGQLVPVKMMMHQCALCKQEVLLDSDHIAAHLKTHGHNITHKNYNANYMQDSRDTRQKIAKQIHWDNKDDIKQEHIKLEPQLRNQRKKVIPLLEYDEDDDDYKAAMTSGGKTRRKQDVVNHSIKVKEESDQVENDSSESWMTNSRTSRKRKKVIAIFDYDEEDAYQKAMKASLMEMKTKTAVDLDDLNSLKKLSMNSRVTVKKTKLTADQTEKGFITVEEIKLEKFDLDVKMEPLPAEESGSGKRESEEVEKHITRYSKEGKIIKKCNICSYSTDRSEQDTINTEISSFVFQD